MAEKVIKIIGNELYHFGVKGQKWGDRQYQNEDGSLTPEGYIHYGYGKGNARTTASAHSRDKKVSNKTIKVEKKELQSGVGGGAEDEDTKKANEISEKLIKEIEDWIALAKENNNKYVNQDVSSWLDPNAKPGYDGSIEFYIEDYLDMDSSKLSPSVLKKVESSFKQHFGVKHSEISENELYHFGIPGQKWYKRRYQNEDGTYTEEGKERRRTGSDDYKRAKELSKKGIKNLSNKELQELNNRQNLERQYAQNNATIGAKLVGKYENVLIGAIAGLASAATIAKGREIVNKFKG